MGSNFRLCHGLRYLEHKVSNITKKITFVFFVFALLIPISQVNAWEPMVKESMEAEAIKARIAPLGKVEVDGERAAVDDGTAVTLGPDSGQKRYDKSCAVCHAGGLAGAPKFRNKGDWADRLPMGIDALLASAIKGKGGMPPKGTCMKCSDEELKMSIEYMIPQG